MSYKFCILFIFSAYLSGCGEDVATALAKCEEKVHSSIGAKSRNNASHEYTLEKGEIVRVCMIAKGRKLDGQKVIDTLGFLESDARSKNLSEEQVQRLLVYGKADLLATPSSWK